MDIKGEPGSLRGAIRANFTVINMKYLKLSPTWIFNNYLALDRDLSQPIKNLDMSFQSSCWLIKVQEINTNMIIKEYKGKTVIQYAFLHF